MVAALQALKRVVVFLLLRGIFLVALVGGPQQAGDAGLKFAAVVFQEGDGNPGGRLGLIHVQQKQPAVSIRERDAGAAGLGGDFTYQKLLRIQWRRKSHRPFHSGLRLASQAAMPSLASSVCISSSR